MQTAPGRPWETLPRMPGEQRGDATCPSRYKQGSRDTAAGAWRGAARGQAHTVLQATGAPGGPHGPAPGSAGSRRDCPRPWGPLTAVSRDTARRPSPTQPSYPAEGRRGPRLTWRPSEPSRGLTISGHTSRAVPAASVSPIPRGAPVLHPHPPHPLFNRKPRMWWAEQEPALLLSPPLHFPNLTGTHLGKGQKANGRWRPSPTS